MKPMLRGPSRTGALALFLALTLALSGCASVFLVDNDVQSFARWNGAGVPSGEQRYRFERLPSQQDSNSAQSQAELERLSAATLARLGWTQTPDAAQARWTVQVTASTLRLPRAPWEEPWFGPWGGWGLPGRDYLITGSGQVIWMPMFPRMEQPYYQRSFSLLIRDASSGRVVYETRAAHDGRWHSSAALWTAMIDAALQGFPAPPSGERRINIEVPR